MRLWLLYRDLDTRGISIDKEGHGGQIPPLGLRFPGSILGVCEGQRGYKKSPGLGVFKGQIYTREIPAPGWFSVVNTIRGKDTQGKGKKARDRLPPAAIFRTQFYTRGNLRKTSAIAVVSPTLTVRNYPR